MYRESKVDACVSNSLDKFSVDELLEELARRRRAWKNRRPIRHFCDDCGNFKTWTHNDGPIDDYNPCSKGHAMSFRMPEGYTDTDYGFYRRVCADRLTPESSEST